VGLRIYYKSRYKGDHQNSLLAFFKKAVLLARARVPACL
jgi:hypothetical protein